MYSLESEKDSFARYSVLTPTTLLNIAERLDTLPDVVAIGGWQEQGANVRGEIGAGYRGFDRYFLSSQKFFGKEIDFFSSSHERSHIFGAIGMAPSESHVIEVVLVWEGTTGAFFMVNKENQVVKRVDVMDQPGAKYAALFAILDPGFAPEGGYPRDSDAGKLMALAAYADPRDSDADIRAAVERVLAITDAYPIPKNDFSDTVLFNAGESSEIGVMAAAVISERLFEEFSEVARQSIPRGLPLRISGGCGLNCSWNQKWRTIGHFSEVFVPPCPNDSGSAIGTAVDAQAVLTGQSHIEWDVYSGLNFVNDVSPSSHRWHRRSLDHHALADTLASGRVVAWVQGRWEIGPRALGNRSLLADAQSSQSKERLNKIKQREHYRPIAPAARIEDLAVAFDSDFEDPHMLYFRRVRDARLKAVTHVDGSARVQTVSQRSNATLHQFLSAVADRQDLGVVCNTSLNFSGHGFINRMSDLIAYCESRNVTEMVVGLDWYQDSYKSRSI
ncbi:carbamoyltransferase C-terminal domain-containing protein [Nocardia aurea]|uniref:carbamoyltransferase C-terminal domain-containing protein n=1 Tax=Nocardia aurea TaxID=2144174 RepID=UPI0022B826CB|nr:carbamoyltransferase C-terminal domain-containing protein [Nocardia aurea]